MSRILAIVVALALTSTAAAEVKIAAKHRVKNHPCGACMVASLEMAGLHLGYEQARGMTAWYASECARTGWCFGLDSDALDEYLDILGIPHRTSQDDLAGLRRAVDAGLPAIIGFKPWSALGSHAAVCVDVTDTHVYFVDPNKPLMLFRYAIEDFVDQWDGWCCVLKRGPR